MNEKSFLDDLFDDEPEVKEEKPEKKTKKELPDQGGVKVFLSHRMGLRNEARKVRSEQAIEAELNWHFKDGDSYHCFSFGDVDSLTYFKMVLRQQHIKFAFISTWCMAGEDVNDLRKWYRRGMIDRVDFYVGEIFRGSYSDVYNEVQKFIKEENGRMVTFKNYSKVMAIKGDKFDCLIESSANVNTNPRSENTVLTVDTELVNWYINLFADIKPFNDDFGAEPYRVN